jgi:hypothetical protein
MYHCAVVKSLVIPDEQAKHEPTPAPACLRQARVSTVLPLNLILKSPAAPSWLAYGRLVGAVLAEQHDEWTEMRRCIGLDAFACCRAATTSTNTPSRGTATNCHHHLKSQLTVTPMSSRQLCSGPTICP